MWQSSGFLPLVDLVSGSFACMAESNIGTGSIGDNGVILDTAVLVMGALKAKSVVKESVSIISI
jgi:hypothetical protein